MCQPLAVPSRGTSAREQVVRAAVVGALLAVGLVLFDVQARGGANPVSLVQPGSEGPSAAAVQADFPDLDLPNGIGHDGQQFYAIARDPFPLDRSAEHLDRPQYRMQRPLYPWLAWALHPQGGGIGLVWALFAVGVAGIVVGGIALGTLVHRRGGSPLAAVLVGLLPGAIASLRISTADTLALGLGLAAVAALGNRRWWPVVPLAVAAVLAKEPTLVLLASVALVRRDRPSLTMAGAAAAAVGLWALVVRSTVPADTRQVIEFVAPLTGWWDAAGTWLDGKDLVAAITCAATIGLAVAAVVRAPRGEWTIPILVQLAFLSALSPSAIGLDYNATRTTMPLLAIALVALLSPAAQPVRELAGAPSQGATGAVGPALASGGSSNR